MVVRRLCEYDVSGRSPVPKGAASPLLQISVPEVLKRQESGVLTRESLQWFQAVLASTRPKQTETEGRRTGIAV